MSDWRRVWRWGVCAAAVLFSWTTVLRAQDIDALKKEVDELREQNRQQQIQLQHQQELIDQLGRKFSGLQQTNELQASDVRALQAAVQNAPVLPEKGKGFSLGNTVISGEGGAGFFETQRGGQFPNAAFRLDEARLFVDAPIWNDVYFYGEVDLLERESIDDGVYAGEVYLEWENLAKHWGQDDLLNLRVGQIYTPFGEEYQTRFAIDNVLIAHSLSDLWGLNPGLELFGSWEHLTYAVAVQNGGISVLNDFTADKSVIGRVGYDPRPWLHLSVSGMRTGNLSVIEDGISALWFGNGFFQSVVGTNATTFHVNLAEIDAQAKWKGGYVRAAGGYAGYGDNDSGTDDHRDIYYDLVEARQFIVPKFYGAVRWSQIHVHGGYPIVGDSDTFGLPTSDIWRLSLGLGYQFSEHLLWKAEYMFEQGNLVGGGRRNHEDMLATEAAFKF
jgi:hypothetical protein